MSGGVDSSVAACLLVEQGYEVVGLFMRSGVKAAEEPSARPSPWEAERGRGEDHALALVARTPTRPHQGCCSASDAADARFVAGKLGIPFYALNFEEEFETLIDYFVDEYARGRTPNPCVVCNNKLKFGKIVDYADAVGAKYIATGHYARVDHAVNDASGRVDEPSLRPSPSEGERVERPRTRLLRGVDRGKDQSYVLFGLERAVLDRVLFPIGHLTKPEVREIAARYDLPNRNKPDSVEICFVPDRNYARLVRERRPEAFGAGDVIESGTGRVLGRHDGVPNYTVGQRRGLRIAAGVPIYVTALNADTNTVVMGRDDALLQDGLSLERVNLLVEPPTASFRALVKIRYLHSGASGMVHLAAGQTARIKFDEAQRAITPGQAAVFYDGDTVLGGGWIVGGCVDPEA